MVTEREISNTAKLSAFQSAFLPILPYWPGSWLMTERMLSQVQTGELGLLRYIVHGITPCEKMCNLEIRKALNVEPPLSRIERSYLRWFGHVSRMFQERLARQIPLATLKGKQPRDYPSPGGLTTSPTLLCPIWACSLQKYLRYLLTTRYFESSYDCCPRDPLTGAHPVSKGEVFSNI